MTCPHARKDLLSRSFVIVAADDDGAIGRGRDIPWKHSADMKRFKERTQGCALVVGRTTFETLPASMPGRTVIVVTSRDLPEGCSAIAASSYEHAIDLATDAGVEAIAFAGGSGIYKKALADSNVTIAYVTKISGRHDGDVFLPQLGDDWDVSGWMPLESKDGEPEATVFRHDRTSS